MRCRAILSLMIEIVGREHANDPLHTALAIHERHVAGNSIGLVRVARKTGVPVGRAAVALLAGEAFGMLDYVQHVRIDAYAQCAPLSHVTRLEPYREQRDGLSAVERFRKQGGIALAQQSVREPIELQIQCAPALHEITLLALELSKPRLPLRDR